MNELLNLGFTNIEGINLNKDLAKVAGLYADVFAGAPWNEYTQCPGCSEFFGLETNPGEACKCCNGTLSLAYPKEKTEKYILKENSNPGSTFFVAREGSQIVGFAWGYKYDSASEFSSQKYKTDEMRKRIENLLLYSGLNKSFFYFSECGVSEDQRGKGLSNILFEQVVKNNYPLIMRTNCKSPMTAVAQRYRMKQIMGPEIKIDRTKKLILPLENFINGCYDLEIEERVLFLLK